MTIDFFVVSLQKIFKNMETKKCIKCQEVKTLSKFGKRKGKTLNRCKKCMCLSSKERYENNKEKIKQYQKEWRKNNKEKMKQYHKERYENNKEKVKERYENNKEKIKQRSKEWYENNKEKAKQNKKEWRENNKEKAKQYYKKARNDFKPSYIIDNLKKQGFNKEQITPELIEENANIIKVKRIIKKINESIN